MTTNGSLDPETLIAAVRTAGEEMMTLAAEVERELAHETAVRHGQLVLLERTAVDPERALERRIARYVAEVLEPLEGVLGAVRAERAAVTPGYLHDQDGIQKRMIWDLQGQVRMLRAQVATLRSLILAGRHAPTTRTTDADRRGGAS